MKIGKKGFISLLAGSSMLLASLAFAGNASAIRALDASSVASSTGTDNVCNHINITRDIGISPKIISEKPIANGTICQIVAKLLTPRGPRTSVLYGTKDFTLIGMLFENRVNLTARVTSKIGNQQFSGTWAKYKKQLPKFVATTYTPKNADGKIVYEIADPNCPFCARMKPYLEKYANKYGYIIKIVFFSFERPSSPKKTSNFICNHRTFAEYIANDIGTKTCAKGDAYVRKANQMAHDLGVNGTPTYIFNRTGTKIVGANPTALANAMKEGK